MIIRKATKKDLEALWKLEQESSIYHKKIVDSKFVTFLSFGINNEEKRKTNYFKAVNKDLKSKNRNILIAEENNKVRGYIWGELHGPNKMKYGYIGELAVAKQYKGKGIASKLMATITNWFKGHKAKYIRIDAFTANKNVIEIYKHFGYDPIKLQMIKKL